MRTGSRLLARLALAPRSRLVSGAVPAWGVRALQAGSAARSSRKHAADVMETHHMPHEGEVFLPSAEFVAESRLKSEAEYRRLYERSIRDPEGFWGEVASGFQFHKKWDRVLEADFSTASFSWFKGAKLNVTENCLDRHVAAGRGDAPALTWEADDGASTTFSYRQVLEHVSRIANVLRAQSVRKGDPVTIVMPMVPDLAFAILACARIGAPHSVIFAGFSAEAIADRIVNCGSEFVITTDAGIRGGKPVPLKANVDKAVAIAATKNEHVKKVFVTHRAGAGVGPGAPGWVEGRDFDLDSAKAAASPVCVPEVMDAEDPLFLLYTSGSTGAPKGVLHTQAGYMVYAAETFKYVFDYRPGKDVHFCTADLGWVTGHSYILYGPLANGAHSVMFEGVPTFPNHERFWQIVDKHKVTTFYTAPTALRSLMVFGEEPVKKYDLSSLRLLGSVGEAINPETWLWYHRVVGKGKLPIVDTWWQTETGACLVAPLPGCTPLKPGCATRPFFGVEPEVLHKDGAVADTDEAGYLTIKKPWPGMMRTVYGDHERFLRTYFTEFPGRYTTGDGARIDKDGYVWIMGRTDDVINVSGHRLSTAEVESALVLHADVVEAAVVGVPHKIKGEGIYCYITLRAGATPSKTLEDELVALVRKQIGALAKPDAIHFTPTLPKTRSGKIMRRILRKISAGETDTSKFGDTSTLSEPAVVAELIKGRKAV